MSNEIVLSNNANIESLIYEIRGKQVMLSSDVAKLYQVETRRINEVIKRNIKRLPESFCFRLNRDEFMNLKSQNAISSINNNYGGVRYLPYVLTEQGIMMLSGLLKSDVAVKVNIQIINAFVIVRKYISANLLELNYLENQVLENKNDIIELKKSFEKFEEKKTFNDIYYNGQIYDAYSKILDIFKMANKELIIIDAYADKVVLDIIRYLDVKVLVITTPNNLLHDLDIKEYNEQYNNLEVIFDKTFHDRYFIIDGKEVYHCGTSINKIGSKTFSITLMNDENVYKSLIGHVRELIKDK